MTTLSAGSRRDQLVRRLTSLSSGSVSVVSVDVKDDYWPDDRPIQVVVHLSDPAGDTWDFDDMSRLTAEIYGILAEFDVLSASRTTFTGGPAVDDVPPPDEDAIDSE